ncbi:MAG: hypothetical protein AAF609_26910 [Cyanobacteria bacterium P01_C01_bin.120]
MVEILSSNPLGYLFLVVGLLLIVTSISKESKFGGFEFSHTRFSRLIGFFLGALCLTVSFTLFPELETILGRVLSFSLPIIAILSIVALIVYAIDSYGKNRFLREQREVNQEVENFVGRLSEGDDDIDVLKLMRQNLAELREYYVINKRQATRSFLAALFMSILGFILFAGGIGLTSITRDTSEAVLYSTIAGVIVEIISGLFFWLYSRAIKQINIFHASLLSTQKFLTAIQLINNISDKNKDAMYAFVIQSIIEHDIQAVGSKGVQESTKKSIPGLRINQGDDENEESKATFEN